MNLKFVNRTEIMFRLACTLFIVLGVIAMFMIKQDIDNSRLPEALPACVNYDESLLGECAIRPTCHVFVEGEFERCLP